MAVTGTFACSSPGTQEAVAINVTGFTDTGPVGASYTYEVLLAGVVQTSASTSSHVQALSTSRVDDKTSTVWTLRIRSVLGPWTGTAYTRSITCVRKSSNSGTL